MNSILEVRLSRQRQSAKNIFEGLSSGAVTLRYKEQTDCRDTKMSTFTYIDVTFRKNNSLFRLLL
jgi:hypothetical protein